VMTMPDDDVPGIQIDSDWKAEAQAEKQRLATEARNKEGNTAGGPGQMPPADFETLVSTNVSQALLFLGALPDPRSGQRILSLDMERLIRNTITRNRERSELEIRQGFEDFFRHAETDDDSSAN